MSKMKVSTAALAFVASFAMGGVQIAQASQHASEICGTLPNVQWSWRIEPGVPVISGGETSTEIGDVSYNPVGNVGKADVTTTTEPTIETTTVTCTALNPAGKVNADHSTTVETVVVLDPGGTTTSNEVVCNPGASLPNCPL